MKKIIIVTICVFGITYGLIATIFGYMVIVFHSWEHPTDMAYSMNDATQVMVSNDGYIYVLGRSLVQRFDMNGRFCGGGYFSVGGKRVTNGKGHGELMSLNDENIIVFSIDGSKICIFDNNFNVVSVNNDVDLLSYGEKEFYEEYPITNISNIEVKMSLFSNAVNVDGKKVVLDAPRNMWFSYLAGVPILILSVVLLVFVMFHKEDAELKMLRKKYGKIQNYVK